MQFLIFYSLIIIIIINCLPSFGLNTQGANFCKFPKATSTNVTKKVIFVIGHKDFGYQRIIYNGKKNTCRPNMQMYWEQAIILTDGASISNLIMGASPDGTSSNIECMGSCTLTNVFFENVCWRGVSFHVPGNFKKGDKRQFTYTVNGGGALDGFQKIFDHAGPGKTIINNFCSVNNAIGIVSCGNCTNQYPREITIQNSKFKGPMLLIAGSNQGDKVVLKNVEVYGANNPSTKIKYACSENVQSAQHRWDNSYKPGQAGGKSCCYAANAVKLVN